MITYAYPRLLTLTFLTIFSGQEASAFVAHCRDEAATYADTEEFELFLNLLICFQLRDWNEPYNSCITFASKYAASPSLETGKNLEKCLVEVDYGIQVLRIDPESKEIRATPFHSHELDSIIEDFDSVIWTTANDCVALIEGDDGKMTEGPCD